MTPAEFRSFLLHALGAFPTMAEVFTSSQSPETTRAAWYGALSDCTLKDSKAAIDAMLRGDLEVPAYKWDRIPAIVRGYAKPRAGTVEPEQPSYVGEWVPVSADVRIGDAVGKILRRVADNGESIADAHRAVDPFRGLPDDVDRQPRHRCRWCQDSQSGYVAIWRHCVVVRFRDLYLDELPATWKRDTYDWLKRNRTRTQFDSLVACCCDSKAARYKREKSSGPAVLDPERMPVYRGDVYFEIDRLREWVRTHDFELTSQRELEY